MSVYKQIPGVETRFTTKEIAALIEHFNCKTMHDLIQAARRYESLFFCFYYEDEGYEPRPYDAASHMRLALALAESVFDNVQDTDTPLIRRHVKRARGRTKGDPLPPGIADKLKEVRKIVGTNEAAVQRLMALGTIQPKPNQIGKIPSAKSILRAIQKAEKERNDCARQAAEDFKDLDLSQYLPLKEEDGK